MSRRCRSGSMRSFGWSTSCRCCRPPSRAATSRRARSRPHRLPRNRRRRAASATGSGAGSAKRAGPPSRVRGRRSARSFASRRIDQPEAMLLAPDQAFFLRENLKLRLLNARLALLARRVRRRAWRPEGSQRGDRALLRSLVAAHADRARSDHAGGPTGATVGAGASRRHLRGARRRRAMSKPPRSLRSLPPEEARPGPARPGARPA